MAKPDESWVISYPYQRDFGGRRKKFSDLYFGGKFKFKIVPFCMKRNLNGLYLLVKSYLCKSSYSPRYLPKVPFKIPKKANGAVAARSKASVTTSHENPQSVSSTPADDAGETDWTTYGKVAIFCNL